MLSRVIRAEQTFDLTLTGVNGSFLIVYTKYFGKSSEVAALCFAQGH